MVNNPSREMTEIRSRLELRSGRVTVTAEAAIALVSAIFRALGCSEGVDEESEVLVFL